MRRIHIIGGKNHGKTKLICELIAELCGRGLRVGTVKHTHHHHELDTPGKDSHRHRESGAAVVGILSPSMNAVFWPNSPGERAAEPPSREERYAALAPAFRHCDFVLVEGDTRTPAPKMEVWRASLGTAPIADRVTDVVALVSDDAVQTAIPTIPRRNSAAIADFLLNVLGDETT